MDTTASTSPAGGIASNMMASITTIHLILIAILAVVVIIGIWWGAALKRRRKAAEAEFDAHQMAAAERTGAIPIATPDPDPSPLADEPVAAAAPLDAGPAAFASSVGPPASSSASAPVATPGSASELTQLKGLGPKLAATLRDLGITRIDQIAALGPAEAEALDAKLGAFRGRMARDRWIEQARLLSRGDRAGYEASFGNL